MPWSPAQHRLFEGIAHGSIPAKAGLTAKKASQMASEGIKSSPASSPKPSPKQYAKTLSRMP